MNRQLRRKLDHITDILWAGGVTNPVTLALARLHQTLEIERNEVSLAAAGGEFD